MTLLALVTALALQSPIVEVEVRGNRLVPDATVEAYLGPLEAFSAPDAFRRLWATGLFEDLRFETENAARGAGRKLVVVVREKKLLRNVRIEGDGIEPSDLRRALAPAGFPLLAGEPFGPADAVGLARATRGIVGPDLEAEAEIVDAGEDQVDVVLRIQREKKPAVIAIAFLGNEAFDDDALRSVMRLRPKGLFSRWLRRDRFDPAVLEDDVERIRGFYRHRGFARASVGPAKVETTTEGVSIRIPVSEGAVYRFADFEVEPGPLLSDAQVRGWLPAPGSVFDGAALDEVEERIERHYGSRGYPSARVDASERVVPDGTAITTDLRVVPGDFYRVGRISFSGNRRHRDRDLRALLDLAEAERLDVPAMERGASSIRSLGQFRAVVPALDLTAGPNRADVTYHLQEVEPFEYLVGGGLTGVEGASGNGQLAAKSLLGRSETIRVDLDLGDRFRNVAASYRDPGTLSALGPWARRLVLAADFRRASVTYPDDTSQGTLDVSAGITGPLGSKLQLAAVQRFTRFDLGTSLESDVPFLTGFLGRNLRTARSGLALTYESRNRRIFPSRGRSIELGFELVALDVGAERARAHGVELLSLGRRDRHGLALIARAEAVFPRGRSREEGLPRFERLFLGSENDLRGFDIRGVGPRADGVVVGGDRLFYAGAEYRVSLADRLRLVGFFDLGNVWATDFEGETLPSMRYDAGAELRLLVPVANLPLRLGYGRNLDPLPDERPGRFFVTLELRF